MGKGVRIEVDEQEHDIPTPIFPPFPQPSYTNAHTTCASTDIVSLNLEFHIAARAYALMRSADVHKRDDRKGEREEKRMSIEWRLRQATFG